MSLRRKVSVVLGRDGCPAPEEGSTIANRTIPAYDGQTNEPPVGRDIMGDLCRSIVSRAVSIFRAPVLAALLCATASPPGLADTSAAPPPATVASTAGAIVPAAAPAPAAVGLTARERAWLDAHPVVTFGVNDFPPLIFSDRNGTPSGIGVEFTEQVAHRLGIKIKWVGYPSWTAELAALRDGRLDVASTMANAQTPEGLIAGKPWMTLKGVIVTRHDAPRVTGIEDLANQVVAVQRITPGEMEIGRRFPMQKLLVTDSVPAMLDAVVTGKAGAAVGMLAVMDYAMRNQGYGDSLKLAAPFGEQEVPVRMVVGGDDAVLSDMLDRGIATVTDAERQQILQRWFTTSYAEGPDRGRELRLALIIALPSIAGLALVLYWVARLRREVRWRKAAQLLASQQAEELKQAKAELDQALKRTSGQFQAILDNAPVAIWAKDRAGVYLLANDAFRRLGDFAGRPIVGHRDEDFFPPEIAAQFRDNDRQVIEEECTLSFVEKLPSAQGIAHAGLAVKFPLRDDEGRAYAVAGVSVDISDQIALQNELKKLLATMEQRVSDRTVEARQARAAAEEARRRIVDITDSVPGVVFEFIRDAQCRYSAPFVSGGMDNLIGLSGAAVAEDVMRYFAAVLPEDATDYLAAIEHSAATGGEVRHSFRIRHARTGEIRWLSVHALPPRRENGTCNWRGYVGDITEQKRLAADLELALQRAQAAERAKGDFLANMSHEIRTPMNAIIGMSHLALQSGLTPRQLNYVSKIDAAARSLLGIINDVLDFSKIEAGKLVLETAEFRLQELFDNLTTLIGQRAQQKGLELLFDIDPQIPEALIGDPVRLGQILINLCSNAVKFTEQGEIVVSARLLECSGRQQVIRFGVRDSGIGLTPEQIERLFRPFEQADASTTRRYGGTGLGLSIARRICELMGGEIGVESEPGRGSTFWFTIRLEASQRAVPAAGAGIDGQRVLVVDDNPVAREILASLVASLKLRATAVASGEEAVEVLQASSPPFDIVLTDWKMPGMSGAQLLRRIKRELTLPRPPAVILVTAYGTEDVLGELGDVQSDGLLMKPVNASALFDAIQNALGRKDSLSPQAARSPALVATPDLRGARILLVEDNEVNREVAEEVLAQTGASITVAVNGQEAVEAITPGAFDLVLMDIQMPLMSGEEATRLLRCNPALKDLPIIAMTANAMAGDRERFLACGMNDHVIKPIDVPALFAALIRWMPPMRRPGQAAAGALDRGAAPAVPLPAIEGLDTKQGLARVNGDTAAYLRLLRKFRDGQTEVMGRIRAALERGDYATATREAHSVVGAGGNIGATALAAAASEVERACRHAVPTAQVPLAPMEAALDPLMLALSQALKKHCPGAATLTNTADAGQIAGILRELKVRLDEYDATASDLIDELRARLGRDERIDRIEQYLGRYDFTAAAAALQAMATDFGIALETVE